MLDDKAVEAPSPVAIARALAGLTTGLTADVNYERVCLQEVHLYLSQDPPNLDKARDELRQGMAHAFRQGWREDERPEAWLVAACAQLLF